MQVTEHFREMSLKEKLLQKKKERQAETQKSDVKLEEFSDEEYDTQRRFRVIYCHIVSNFFVTSLSGRETENWFLLEIQFVQLWLELLPLDLVLNLGFGNR